MSSNAQAVTIEELLAYRRWVRALARSLIADPSRADDIEQQAWVAAIEKPPRQAGNVRAWLARVVRRRRVDLVRSATRRKERESWASSRAAVPRPDELVSRAETQACIARAVLALEEPYRNTILLRFFHEMPAREIAVHQAVPLETVRTRLGRALAQLRGRLPRELGPGGMDWRRALLPVAGLDLALDATATAGAVVLTTKSTLVLIAAGLLAALLGVWLFVEDLRSVRTVPLETGLSTAERAARSAESETRDPLLRGVSGARTEPARLHAAAPNTEQVREGSPSPEGVVGGGEAGSPPDGAPLGEPAPPGVIGGVVRDDEGRPLARVLVMLSHPPAVSVVARTLTDEAGLFLFEGLEDQAFLVAAQAGGWANARTTTRPGRHLLDFTMARGLTISGRIVQEGTDLPVPGIFIRAVEGAGGAGTRTAHARSKEDGAFVLRGLGAGSWTLTAGPIGGTPEALAAEFITTHLGPVEAGTADLRIELPRGLDLEGVVHGPDGQPWSRGAGVRVTPVDVGGTVDYVGQRYARTTPTGKFRLAGLPRGCYDLTVAPETESEGGPICSLAHVRGVLAGTTGLVVNLVVGRALVGRVVDEKGQSITERGWVWVSPRGAPPGSPGSAAATLLEGGRFETTPLDPAWIYDVKASGFAGYGGVTLEGVSIGGGDVVVVLSRGFEISGRVVDADGRPAPAGVPVMALVEGHRGVSRPPPPWVYAYVHTDPEGFFTCSGLKDLPYTVQAGGSTSGFVGAATGVLAPAKDVTLRATRGVAFHGRLVDAHGNPVPFATLFGHDQDVQVRLPVAQTRRDGRFAFAGVRAGMIRLTAMIGESRIPLGEFEAPADDVTLTVPE